MAQLVRRVGTQHVELVEDAVQSALTAAFAAWLADGLPRDPGAWLYRVASNHVFGALRIEANRSRLLERVVSDAHHNGVASTEPRLTGEIDDDLLRMLFVCCDSAIPQESQLVFALKTLCGFSTAEIALHLFTTEANVHKRLQRARQSLRERPVDLDSPPPDVFRARLPRVHEVLYLWFNEGYLSSRGESSLRRELCDEAIRLATVLAEHPVGAAPETFALLALMHLHVARFDGRVDGSGALVLLEHQDRGSWDRERMRVGTSWLARAATGDTFSRFHAEAGIAAEHGMAPSFTETRWQEIAQLYAMLDRVAPSPLHTLNRAVAVAEWQGPATGLALLEGVVPPAWLERSYLWDAVLGDLHRRAGHIDTFRAHRERALAAAPTEAIRALLERRWPET